MRKLLHVGLVLGAVGMAVMYGGGGASAGQDPCHTVTLSSSNNPVDEGEIVKIRVERGGIQGTTSFRIRTVNGSAIGGVDYPSFNEKLTWTSQNATIAKNYELVILNDALKEGAETFQIDLSEPGGSDSCTPVDFNNDPLTVTIKASDQNAPPPTAGPTAVPTVVPTPRTSTSTATPGPTASPTASPSPSPSPTPTGTPLATFTPFPSATPSGDDDGLSGLDIAGIAIGAGALASGGLLWYLRSRGQI